MTNFGLFGTILSIDAESNKVVLETSPGNTVTVHRQVIARVVEPSEATDAESDAEQPAEHVAEQPVILNGEPQYGERVDKNDASKTDEK